VYAKKKEARMSQGLTHLNQEEFEVERAFFSEKFDSIGVVFYQNERPLRGLMGLLDWRLKGLLSENVQKGFLGSKDQELLYVPLKLQNNKKLNIFVLGAGLNEYPGERPKVSSALLDKFAQNCVNLGIVQLGLSRTDLGISESGSEVQQNKEIEKRMKGLSLCLYP
jgi:hypothetical protein